MHYKTFVYSPEVKVVIEGVDVSADVVSGNVKRITDGASSLNLVLSNKGFRYTAHHQFKRMDRIVVWLKRVGAPVKVFTGYLNVVPGLQLYPSTVRLQASCTLKKLLYTYWDPGLDASRELLDQARIPWGVHPESGQLSDADTGDDDGDDDDDDDGIGTDIGGNLAGPITDAVDKADLDAEPTVDGLADDLSDSGLGMILMNVLTKAGGWDPDTIEIENYPETFFQLVLANMPDDIHGLHAAGMEKIRDLFDFYEKIQGSTGGGGKLGPLTDNQMDHAKEVYRAAKDMGMDPLDDAVILAYMTVFVESEWRILANPVVPESLTVPNEGIGTDHTSTGLFQQQTHWGTNEQRMNAYGSATLFYDALRKQPNWATRPRGEVCQAVQVSAKPLEYAKREGEAVELLRLVKAELKESGGSSSKSNVPSVNPSTGHPIKKPNKPSTDSDNKDPNAPDTSGMTVWQSIEAVGLYKFPMMQMTSGQAGRYDGTWHQKGKACDFSNAGNEGSQEMKDMTQWWYENFLGKGTLQIIHHPSPFNVLNDVDVGTGWKDGYGGYDSGTMEGHRNHVHIAMDGIVSADGTTSTAGLGGGASAGGNIQWENKLAKNLFTYLFHQDRFNDELSEELTGKHASLNDQPMIQIVKSLCEARMCHFQSTPDGGFLAFYPDYFGINGHRPPQLLLEDIEIKDFNIDINDNALATHVFTQGSQGPDPSQVPTGIQGYYASPGIVTVEDEWLFKLATNEMYFRPEFSDPEEFLARYGPRPFRGQDYSNIDSESNPAAMLVVAIKLFMERWAQQYQTTVDLTFMPELFPGMKMELPSHQLVVYVESVDHSFSYDSGFSTRATVMAPMRPRSQEERDAMMNELLRNSARRGED